jgi:hypothetical protein
MSTITTAPARTKVNKLLTRSITIKANDLVVVVEAADEANAPVATLTLFMGNGQATRITYNDASKLPVAEEAIPLPGVVAAILSAFVGGSGTPANRMLAVDTYLQANGVFPP